MEGDNGNGDNSVCIIGAGISGLIYSDTLKRLGFNPIVFEKNERLGGIWDISNYPRVTLQNSTNEYTIPDYPWPFKPKGHHPTGPEVLSYFKQFSLDKKIHIEFNTTVISTKQLDDDTWIIITINSVTNEQKEHHFKFLVLAVGQFSQQKSLDAFQQGREKFEGRVLTEQQVKRYDEDFENNRVVVFGFGKSALDMASFGASAGAASMDHVFRQPHWVIPRKIFGVPFTYLLFSRMSSVMMTSWGHPTPGEKFLHNNLPFAVDGFWGFLQGLFRYISMRQGENSEQRKRIEDVLPKNESIKDNLRSAFAVDPEESWYEKIGKGSITPHHATFLEFTGPDTLSIQTIEDNSIKELKADVVVFCTGVGSAPKFPFLEDKHREMLEAEYDGVQLFHHIFHPKIKNFAAAGFNHGFTHLPSCTLGAIYVASVWRGDMELPSVIEMEKSIERIKKFKREKIMYEPSRLCAIATRFQQHQDILCQDLQISKWRKFPNIVAELVAPYGGNDYDGVVDEYLANRKKNSSVKLHWLGDDA